MKKEELSKLEHAITFKKKNSRAPKGLVLRDVEKEREKERDRDREKDSYESPTKNRFNFASEDGKSQTNKSTKQKKSLPSLVPPSGVNPIRKMVAQRALVDYMKNLSVGSNYQDKESLQHQTLILKQKNNELTVQNMKLKTKIMNLDSENARMQKLFEEESEVRYPGAKESKLKSNQQLLISTKQLLRQARKELAELKQENGKLKKMGKFTRISELEVERKVLQEEVMRLKELLEEQVAENLTSKAKYNSKSEQEQQFSSLQQTNGAMKKELIECSKKLRAAQEKLKSKADFDKNSIKTINDLKKTLKEKTVQIQNLRKNKDEVKEERSIRSASLNKGKIVRLKCQECNSMKAETAALKQKVLGLERQLQQIKDNSPPFQDIMIRKPSTAELEEVGSFLKYRFMAHHLSFQNIFKYLIKVQTSTISVGSMVENLLVEPFFLIHPAYLETVIAHLFYGDSQEPEVKANEQFQKDVGVIKELFVSLVKPYQLMQPRSQQQIFVQIAQIITQHCDHISAAFDSKRNGEGTISRSCLHEFLTYIQMNQEYIQFIITQIVLQSTDLEHLNYYSLFQIFYLPNSNLGSNIPEVKELDEEYQESQQSGRIRGVEKIDTLHIQQDQEYEQIFQEKDEGEFVGQNGDDI